MTDTTALGVAPHGVVGTPSACQKQKSTIFFLKFGCYNGRGDFFYHQRFLLGLHPPSCQPDPKLGPSAHASTQSQGKSQIQWYGFGVVVCGALCSAMCGAVRGAVCGAVCSATCGAVCLAICPAMLCAMCCAMYHAICHAMRCAMCLAMCSLQTCIVFHVCQFFKKIDY